ncbi:hypothetical protein C0431_13235 [bacterium]|nr:hypothetical protein [bacterium]
MTLNHGGVKWTLKSFPHPLAEGVPIDTGIEVHFIRDLDNTQHIDYLISIKNLVDLSEHPFEAELVGRVVKIKPMFDLLPDSHYQVTINGGKEGLLDVRGERMPMSYTLEFHTKEDRQLQTPVILTPSADSIVQNGFEIAWTSVEGAAYYELEVSRTRTFDPVIWPAYGQKQFDTKVKPVLFAKGTYYVRVRALRDREVSGYSDAVLFVLEGGVLDQPGDVEEGDWTNLIDEVLDKLDGQAHTSGLVEVTPAFGAIEVSEGVKEIRIKLSSNLVSINASDIRVIRERNG